MSRHSKLGIVILAFIVLVAAIVLVSRSGSSTVIRYGISPFQDTAMPKVAEGMGLYNKNGLDVKLVSVAWEDIVPSVASGGEAVNVAIGSINTLLPRAENINVRGGGDVVFYFPLYVFKGASLMMRGDSRIQPLAEFLQRYPNDRERAVREAVLQLRGKVIAVPSGTPYEQMLLAALKIAGMNATTDIDHRDVKLADALYALRNGDADIVGAGVTQRTEAMREGAKVFMDMESFGFAEIIGLVTRAKYAQSHSRELNTLIRVWFESVETLMVDVDKNSEYVLAYLAENASTKYSLDEYKRALEFQVFPTSVDDANNLLLRPDGKFYWKRTWDVVNDYLIETGKIQSAIPYEFFLGEEVLRRLQ